MAESTTGPAVKSPKIPEQLFHTLLLLSDGHHPGIPDLVLPLGTHTDLSVAKDHARIALADLNYHAEDFVKFEVRTRDTKDWNHGDGVVLWAKAPNDSELWVGLETTPNNQQLPEGLGNNLKMPGAYDQLHYVVHTTIDVNKDRSGAQKHVGIEGVYVHRADAIVAAQQLLSERVMDGSIEQYDQRPSLGDEESDWPYGERTIAHAVENTGENHFIAIETVPGTRHWHQKHRASASNQGHRCSMETPDENQKEAAV